MANGCSLLPIETGEGPNVPGKSITGAPTDAPQQKVEQRFLVEQKDQQSKSYPTPHPPSPSTAGDLLTCGEGGVGHPESLGNAQTLNKDGSQCAPRTSVCVMTQRTQRTWVGPCVHFLVPL